MSSDDDITIHRVGVPPVVPTVKVQPEGRRVPGHMPEKPPKPKGDEPWVVRDRMDFGKGEKGPKRLETYGPNGTMREPGSTGRDR